MPAAPAHRLVVIEASKTRNQHSTLVDGILRASAHPAAGQAVPPVLYAHPTLFERLSPEVRAAVDYRPIAVMDPLRRRLVRKSLLEAWVALRAIATLRRDEVLLFTTVLPSSGILIELAKWLFPRKRVAVMLHGEVEGTIDPARQRAGSYGFYMKLWLDLRRRFGSRLDLAVIDEFIAGELAGRFPAAVAAADFYVIPLLIEPAASNAAPEGPARFGFVGFDTPDKGLPVFEALAGATPDADFVRIGGGEVVDLRSGRREPLGPSAGAFLDAIARCDVAVFPYTGGYTMALSAAATDALAAGAHLLTTDRGCFRALAEAFGPDSVTIAEPGAMRALVADPAWADRIRAGRAARLARLAGSRYSLGGVARALANLLAGRPYTEAAA